MPVISRLRARLGAREDRGAVALTVGLLLGSGVLLGMAALVVDVGNLYVERGQLQNGADAGAVKVAQICATDPADCSPEATDPQGTDLHGVAESYADRNANDGAAAATVCGRGGELSACPSWEGRLTDCVGPPPAGGSYVEVHTSTRGEDDSTVLPPVFAQALVGGYKGAEVGACSRVAWGPPMRATTLAMAISACDWNRYTDNGNAFLPPVERSFPVYDEDTSTTCAPKAGPGGGLGGYRWLRDADDDCRVTYSVDDSRGVYTGDSWPVKCKGTLADLAAAKRPVLVPVFSEISGGGGNAEYIVSGFAAFVVTGWYLPGLEVPSAERSACDDGGKSCVFGYFTQTVVPSGGAIGGPDRDLGARIVAPIG